MSTTAPFVGTNLQGASAAAQTLPTILRRRQIAIACLSVAVALIGWVAYRTYADVVQTIGKDSAPSVVAAENIRTTLADAHTNVVNVFLTGEADEGPNVQAYQQAIQKANDHLVTAAQNITYGDEERKPILRIMTSLSQYERRVGAALVDREHSDNLTRADELMRDQILPAAADLDAANDKYLNAAYNEGLHKASGWLFGFLGAAILLIALIAQTNFVLFGAFRRMINLPMATGLAVFVLAVILFAAKAGGITSAMRTAKEDAFDSVYALTQAQALAYVANAQESVYLLFKDPGEQERQTALFQKSARTLFDGDLTDVQHLPGNLKRLQGHGLLGNELANITFSGEDSAAKATLAGWLDYVRIDAQIRTLERQGQHAEAVKLCLGNQPQQSDWAFERFMKALSATLNINQTEFDKEIEGALGNVRWLWMLLIPALLAPLLGSLVGLQQRLGEFRE